MKSLALLAIFLASVIATTLAGTSPVAVPDATDQTGTLTITVLSSPDFFHFLERGIGAGTLAVAKQNGVNKGICVTNSNSYCGFNLPYGTYTLTAAPPINFPLFRWLCTGSATVNAVNVAAVVRCKLRFLFFMPSAKNPKLPAGQVFQPSSPFLNQQIK